jgi:hypothetical protein
MKYFFFINLFISSNCLFAQQILPPPRELDAYEKDRLKPEDKDPLDYQTLINLDKIITTNEVLKNQDSIKKAFKFEESFMPASTIYSLDSLSFSIPVRDYLINSGHNGFYIRTSGIIGEDYPHGSYSVELSNSHVKTENMDKYFKTLMKNGGKLYVLKVGESYWFTRFNNSDSYKKIKKSITPLRDWLVDVKLCALIDTLIDKKMRIQLIQEGKFDERLNNDYTAWRVTNQNIEIKELKYGFNDRIQSILSIKVDVQSGTLIWAKFEGLGVNEQFLIDDLINSGYMYNQATGVFYNASKKIGLRITKNGGMFEVEVYI